MGRKVTSHELRVASQSGSASPRLAASPQPPAPSPRRRQRPGISLLEVLISMFVLLFGLMGVAAVFPVGNHFAGKGEQYDRGAALAEQAFADIKARGMLDPQAWVYPDPAPGGMNAPNNYRVIRPATTTLDSLTFNSRLTTDTAQSGPGHAFVIDPVGVAASREAGCKDADVFPFAIFNATNFDGTGGKLTTDATNLSNPWPGTLTSSPPGILGNRWPVRRVTVPAALQYQPTMTRGVAEHLCRLRDDVANSTPDDGDKPGAQGWAMQVVGVPDDPNKFVFGDPTTTAYANDAPMSRSYGGSYSWLATVVPAAITSPVPPNTNSNGVNALQPIHPLYREQEYDVSVAVFHKRDVTPSAKSERAIEVTLNQGGEIVFHCDGSNGLTAVDNALADVFPGSWVAIAGVHPTSGLFILRWYKLQSLDTDTAQEAIVPGGGGPNVWLRRAMATDVEEWPARIDNTGNEIWPVTGLRGLIMPGVISVVTHQLKMERN